MMAVTATERRSTTEEETVGMTLEAEVEAQEEITVEGILVVVEVQVSPSSTEVRDLQKDQVEAVGAAATISVNRAIITPADEDICAASETGFDILQAPNAVYVWAGHQ